SSTTTSTVPTVVSVPTSNVGRLLALTNGSANVFATYQGFRNTQAVSVVSLSLTHRYGFNSPDVGDTNCVDSVTGATNGIVVTSDLTSGQTGSGSVLLSGSGTTSGSSNNYVQLPADLFTNY